MHGGGLYVTGTDTGVGKTVVAAAIIRRLAAGGCLVGGYKPVASGVGPGCHAESDALILWEAAGRRGSLAAVCPQAFAAPISPPRSARAEGRTVDERLLVEGFWTWRSASEVVVVEGAGGLFSPLADTLTNADLARRLGLPLVVVDAARLGAIGRTLGVVRAAAAADLRIAAVVLSQVAAPSGSPADPASTASIARDSAIDIAARIAPVPVAMLGHDGRAFVPDLDWRAVAGG